ncbi:hypothetical protein V1J52_20070 [Streptomyces sp. TRM 70351]|uniref:hypothetical protein n=1 Tax=Streptomyces sp. TRM 70351 TaxID=3116552 RepID=UPI002E7B7CA6|nr:hypothetical protein [Streptomyces sp. TRM 70351]MEE1930452.1 hypothetical protein [Streptomyces sp. TRM 70351]
MVTPRTGIRAARAAVFTAVCVVLSAGTHVLLSAAPVPLPVLLAVTGAVFLCAYALAGRARGYGATAAALVPLELAADTVFTSGQVTCYGAAGGPVTGPLRSLGLDLVCAGGGFGTPLARMAADAPTPALAHPAAPWLLLGAHGAVGLAAAAWLWRGEEAFARLWRAAAARTHTLLHPLLARAAARALPVPRPAPSRAAHRVRAPHARPLLTHSVVRRGPPRPAAG